MRNRKGHRFEISSLMIFVILISSIAFGQRITGGITGQVTDPQGAVVSGAKVTVQNEATGLKLETKTSDQGSFQAASLQPAVYKVTVEAAGFAPYTGKVIVRVGIESPFNAKLAVGAAATEVSVQADAVYVDTTKATVQGVISSQQIDELPLNGRNFLDLAQLAPGVQIVDGGSFDPTKNGFAGVSVGGRTGRVTRIQVDGVDITDETVGTTVTNISNESIQEFGISQSSLDPSTDVTSSGAINIITKSGTNKLHGGGFLLYRNQDLAADQRLDKTTPSAAKPDFHRRNWGSNIGGPAIKDKLFWHAEYENTDRVSQTFTNIPEFPQFTGAFGTPFVERLGGARADWNVGGKVRTFYRFTHNDNIGVTGFGNRDTSAFSNRNNTNAHVFGIDYASGHWTHSGRYSYLNFNNFIQPADTLAGTPTTLDPSGKLALVRIATTLRNVGPDSNAPQSTFQDNKQFKYDTSVILGKHTLRMGWSYNRIVENVFANFFGLAPRVAQTSYSATTRAFANTNPFSAKGQLDPLNFAINQIVLGNGLGFSSELPSLGLPFGGTTNNRTGLYAQDTWKWTPKLTVNAALRWNYNSGINDSDLARTPTLNLFDPALARTPRRVFTNFGPQAGFAYDVFGKGKTVIRGGVGQFYETNIINNLLGDRILQLPPGFGNDVEVYSTSTPKVIDPRNGSTLFDFTTSCTNVGGPGNNNCFSNGGVKVPIGKALPFVQQAQALFQAASTQLAAHYPPTGVAPLFDSNLDTGGGLLNPDYKTPYAVQINIGVQHEIKPGLVLSVDYLRNRGVRFNQTIDHNRIGAANTLDVPTAQAAIAATNASFGCATIACSIAAGASISDFSDNGLGAGSGVDGFAFSGKNRNFRSIGVIDNIGLSLFQALQVNLSGNVGSYGPIKHLFTTINYQLGKFQSTGIDQDFLSGSAFNDNPTKFFGPAGIDRRHQLGLSFGMELPWGFHINSNTQIKSGLATSVFLPSVSGGADEIFYTDLDGDGVSQDPLPGTNRGAFGRTVSASGINNLIGSYNTSVAGNVTPAGQALINAGLFTKAQLVTLGAVAQPVATAPTDQVGNDGFFNTDLRLSNKIKVREGLVVEPMIEVFNLFNIANYVSLTSTLDGSKGSINGTSGAIGVATRGLGRLGFGSGSFSPGTQRAFQLGLRITF